jgi:hypothetical protein
MHIRYAEQWDSEEALNDHIRSDLYRRVLAAMEFSKQPPEIIFHFTSHTKGFELVEALRRPSKLASLGSEALGPEDGKPAPHPAGE